MKIAHVTSATPRAVSGITVAVTMLSSSLDGLDNVTSDVYSVSVETRFQVESTDVHPVSSLCYCEYDVVVIAGIYSIALLSVAKACTSAQVPYIVSPHGSLVIPSLRKGWWKKLPFWVTLGCRYVNRATALHFLTTDERAASIFRSKRSIVCSNAVAVNPCNVDRRSSEKIIGYLGRYDLVPKGLDILLDGVCAAALHLRRAGWSVELHGSRCGRTSKEALVKICVRRGIDDLVTVGDALFGADKRRFFERISLFVCSSRYEGQPISAMEAMGNGCALIATEQSNLGGIIAQAQCGQTVATNADALAHAFLRLLSEDQLIEAWQLNAYQYAKKAFAGETVARTFLNELRNVIDNTDDGLGSGLVRDLRGGR